MQVHEVMSNNPVTVRAGSSIRRALRLLADHRVTNLPVVDETGRILGVVSEVDLLRGRLRAGPGLKPTQPAPGSFAADHGPGGISDLMTRCTGLVHPGTDLMEVGRILEGTSYKSLPVVDAADQVVGMVSRSDIVQVLAREDDVLQQDVNDALSAAGLYGWRARVRNGAAELTRPSDEYVDDVRARVIAEATPGITSANVLVV
jgi:CBS-domain-containing membrane protein